MTVAPYHSSQFETMMNNSNHIRWPTSKVAATAILVLCIVTLVLVDEESFIPQYFGGVTVTGRRGLLAEEEAVVKEGDVRKERQSKPQEQRKLLRAQKIEIDAPYPWAQTNLTPLTAPPNLAREQAVFWHIPKSGGTTMKSLFQCLRKVTYTVSKPTKIEAAQKYDIVPSHKWDVLFTSSPKTVIQTLLSEEHPGRVLSMFRHPVERLISKFYYLQTAKWENTYRPEWASLLLLDWAKSHNRDNNHYVNKLAGKNQFDTATESDLELAKLTIQSYFVVGLTNQMKESVRRFNVMMGIDDVNDEMKARCVAGFFPDGNGRRSNANPHPEIEKDDPAYQLLAEKNALDIQLYQFVEELFEQQKELIESYKMKMTPSTNMNELPMTQR